jgi:hypothetical protein
VFQKPCATLTQRTPASTSRRAASNWSFHCGAPSPWCFDEPPADLRIFFLDVQRFDQPARGQHVERALISRVGRRQPLALDAAAKPINLGQKAPPIGELARRNETQLHAGQAGVNKSGPA